MSEPRTFWIYETMVSGKFREGWYSQNPCPFKSHYIEIPVIEKSAYDELKTKLENLKEKGNENESVLGKC